MFAHRVDDEISLVLPEDRYAAQLFALIEASRPELEQWMRWVESTRDVRDLRDWVAWVRRQWADGNGLQLVILYCGDVAGATGFNQIDHNDRKAEIGYWLGTAMTGKGIMTRAVEGLLQIGFEELLLGRIAIRAATGNDRSRAVPERLGFVHEGTLRHDTVLHGEAVNHELYAMLAADWRARR